MRFVRIPFYYLPDKHLTALFLSAYRCLRIIHDIHNDIPNPDHYHEIIRFYQYDAAFLRWSHAKAATEIKKRKLWKNDPAKLEDGILRLKSRPLKNYIPPKEEDIAEDVAWCFQQWSQRLRPGGIPMPATYLELARRYHDIQITEASDKRVDEVSGVTPDFERYWYYPQGEEEAQICDNSLGKDYRLRRNE